MNTDTRDQPTTERPSSIASQIEALHRLAPVIEAAVDDSAYPALSAWQSARLAELEALQTHSRLEDEDGVQEGGTADRYAVTNVDPAHRRVDAAYQTVALRAPTTVAGVVAQLRVAQAMEANQAPISDFAPPIGVLLGSAADSLNLLRRPVTPAAEDPAVIAFERWRQAREAELDFYRRSPDLVGDDCPEFAALEQAAMKAERDLANVVATTPAGLAGQIRFAFRIFGELKPERLGIEPDDYDVPAGMEGGGGAELLLNMLAGAERMAREGR